MERSAAEEANEHLHGRGRSGALRKLAALAGLALLCSGCAVKGADNANLIVGKQAFVAKCGSCHTLARADTKGIVGPNLDEAFRASIAEGEQRNTIRSVVEYQVSYPNPEGVMPKGLAHGATLSDIAAYIAQSAAAKGPDTGLLATAVEAPGAGKTAVEKAGKLALEANPAGQLAYTSSKATATPGAVTITMSNMSGVNHNIAIESGENGATAKGSPIAASSFITKGSTSISVDLKPGKYTFFCQAPGHRAAGMYGTIEVK
jgi:plastocyanin